MKSLVREKGQLFIALTYQFCTSKLEDSFNNVGDLNKMGNCSGQVVIPGWASPVAEKTPSNSDGVASPPKTDAGAISATGVLSAAKANC